MAEFQCPHSIQVVSRVMRHLLGTSVVDGREALGCFVFSPQDAWEKETDRAGVESGRPSSLPHPLKRWVGFLPERCNRKTCQSKNVLSLALAHVCRCLLGAAELP